jgi:Right handed beta helix region
LFGTHGQLRFVIDGRIVNVAYKMGGVLKLMNGSNVFQTCIRFASYKLRAARAFALFLFTVLSLAVPLSANTLYIAQAATGAADGSSCANAHNIAFFNNGASWGAGPSQIGPGTTVHLCGTITQGVGNTALTFQGSGTSGSPITLLFESGAVLTSPAWSSSTGAISCNSQSFLVIDGGTNGLITDTANGTSLANKVDSTGVFCRLSPSVEIKNLTITNMYVHVGGSSDENQFGTAIEISASDHSKVHNNTIRDAAVGIHYNYIKAGNTDVNIYSNTISNCNWNIGGGDENAGATVSNLNIHDNDLCCMANWDDAGADLLHHNDIFIFAMNGGNISNYNIYNNYMHGDPGGFSTACFFFQGRASNISVFNNVIAPTPQANATGLIYIDGNAASVTTALIANNTIVGPSNNGGNGINFGTSVTGVTIRNNIFSTLGSSIYSPSTSSTFVASNNNVMFNIAGSVGVVTYNNNSYSSVAAWRAASGFDTSSIASNPNLDSNYRLTLGSPTIAAGANLTALSLAIDNDKAGNPRPSIGPWDMGAYQFALITRPLPPSGLAAMVQ